jgi:diguanylate cyclase (GGDEF)-like protein
LIADDEAGTRLVLETLLRKQHYEVVVARDGTEAWAMLQRDDAPTLAIIDWMMPGIDGAEICRKVRESGGSNYVYIIILTAKHNQEDIVVGLDAGADDYLRKPFRPEELQARIRAGERVLKLQSELRVQATRDHLTGAFNRGTVLEILQRELAHSARKQESIAVVLADLDNFKQVNDTYGHLTGDAVLQEAAIRLGARLRNYDALGRYGGEEFLIVLPGCGRDFAQEVAERMCAAVGAAPVRTSAGDIRITVSLGFALSDGANRMKMDDFIAAADEALYRAKREGRNRVAGPSTQDDHESGTKRS